MNILKLFIIHLMLAFGLLTLNPQILNADPLDHWHFRDSLTNTGINSVAYGNDLFVAVSGDYPDTPAILTSPDGAVWTKKDFPAVIFYGVGYANGIFVAVGEDANLYIVKKYIYIHLLMGSPGTKDTLNLATDLMQWDMETAFLWLLAGMPLLHQLMAG